MRFLFKWFLITISLISRIVDSVSWFERTSIWVMFGLPCSESFNVCTLDSSIWLQLMSTDWIDSLSFKNSESDSANILFNSFELRPKK